MNGEEIHSLYSAPNIVITSTRFIWAGPVASMEEGSCAKPTGKRTSRRPRRRWEDNIRIGIKEWYQYKELG